jgi:hypothetical protein
MGNPCKFGGGKEDGYECEGCNGAKVDFCELAQLRISKSFIAASQLSAIAVNSNPSNGCSKICGEREVN